MHRLYPNESRYILEPFCIANANIEFFDLGEEPINREHYTIGNHKEQKNCLHCGLCFENCSVKAITIRNVQKMLKDNG